MVVCHEPPELVSGGYYVVAGIVHCIASSTM